MLPLLLAISMAAPIPKGAGTYEGQIACLITSPTPTVLVLKPDGGEVLSLPIEGIDGFCSAIRQAKRGEFVLLEANSQTGATKTYRLDLKTGAKVKLLGESTNSQTTWSIDNTGKFGYFSEADPAKPNTYQHVKLNLETGKREAVKLGPNYMIEDFAQGTDDQILCFTLNENGKGTSGVAVVSLTTGEATFKTDKYLGSRCISPDGKWLLNSVSRRENNAFISQLECFVVATGKSTPIAFPDGGAVNQSCFSCSADNKHACYVSSSQTDSKLYVASLERKTAKLVYTSGNGVRIADCDWR